MARRQIVFLTRQGCGLCDEALPDVQLAARWLRRDLVVTDINSDAQLEAEYHLRIPVLLDSSGEVAAEGPMGRWDTWMAVWRS